MENTNKEKELWDSFSDDEKDFLMRMSYLYEHFAITDEELLKATWEVANFIRQTKVTDIHPYLFKGEGYADPITRDLIPPCKIGDKIYILKQRSCHWGVNPNESANVCVFCDYFFENTCDYGYYIQERTVTGFYIDKKGLWIEATHENWERYEEKINIHSNDLGSVFFFNEEEAKQYAEICNKKIKKEGKK